MAQFTNEEYANINFVHGFCDRKARATMKGYRCIHAKLLTSACCIPLLECSLLYSARQQLQPSHIQLTQGLQPGPILFTSSSVNSFYTTLQI
jgi:hypothetical protein